MDKLQEYIDQNKESLSSDIYNNLCKLTLDAYKEQADDYYTVKYLTSKIIRTDINTFKNVLENKQQILKLTPEEVRELQKPEICNCNVALERVYNVLHRNPDTELWLSNIKTNFEDEPDLNLLSEEISIKNALKIISIEKIE